MGALVVDAEMRRMMEIRDPGCGLPVQVETSGVNLVEGVGPYNGAGQQVWGAEKGPYEFVRTSPLQ